MVETSVYAPDREVTDLAACDFYHTVDIPGYGTVSGEWDLRGRERAYLGNVDLAGKRVLEIGAASGVLTVAMEAMGADVVAYDLSDDHSWDVVPYARFAASGFDIDRTNHLRRLNNGWWLHTRARGSRARMVYGTAYTVPAAIGPVDVSTFGAILQHLRDPFLALETVARLTRETIIVTDPPPPGYRAGRRYSALYARLWRLPALRRWLADGPRAEQISFRPEPSAGFPKDTWWLLTPELVQRMIAVLGFEDSRVSFHSQRCDGAEISMYTVVGRRTVPL